MPISYSFRDRRRKSGDLLPVHEVLRLRRSCFWFVRSGVTRTLSAIFGLTLCLLAGLVDSRAQTTLYWDANGGTAGTGGTGNWNTSNPKLWRSGSTSGTLVAWSNFAPTDYAVFQGTAGTVTATANVTVRRITFGVSGYTIAASGGNVITLANDGFINTAGFDATVSAPLAGSVGLTKLGAGTLTLSGANTFAGSVSVSAGSLQLGANNVLPNATSVSLAAGTSLDLNGTTETFTGLSGSGSLLMNGGDLTLLGANTFSGSISGAGLLSISNSLTLSGIILNAPDLTINLAGSLNLGAYVNSLGTLNLTGNSILDFGNSSATVLNLANLNLNGYTLTINNWVNTVDYFSTQSWASGAGQAAFDTRGLAPMNQVTFTGYSNNHTAWQSYDKQITPAPEPATYGAFFTGLAAIAVVWRRRRRVAA